MADNNLNHRPLRLAGTCPKCEHTFFFPLDDQSADESCTADCNSCGALLLIQDRAVYLFHEKLHAGNQSWPADGAGTGFIDIK